MFTRRERWGLSSRGWLIVTSSVLVFLSALTLLSHSFLAITGRVDSDILVVEGWVPEYAIHAAVEEFQAGPYKQVLTTGGPVDGSGRYVSDFKTSASVGAECLIAAGLPKESVQMVPARVIGRDRTYTSAIALREWFRLQDKPVRAINVLTEDAHARRTRLLFQKAFGKEVSVGVISVSNPDYKPARWWCYSKGVREVIGESIAYVYARLFFHPADTPPS